MMAKFPEFRVISIEDRAQVEWHTAKYVPYSDFNFVSMWSWDTSGERQIAELNGNLVVLFTDYLTHEPFLSFLGENDPERTALTLIQHALAHDLQPVLKLVPEIAVNGIKSSILKIEEDRSNFDYVYSVPALAQLTGSQFQVNRKMVRRFLRAHPEARLEIVELKDLLVQKHITAVIDTWERNKIANGKQYKLEYELAAIHRIFATASQHNLLVSALFSGPDVLGFSIEEVQNNGYCIGHFWKADTRNEGIYDFFIHKKASHFETLGLSYINYEQDLGIPALRLSKNSYRPVHFLKKYTVSRL